MRDSNGAPQLRQSRAVRLQTTTTMSSYERNRRCQRPGCTTILSRYNPSTCCAAHAGWNDPPGKRSMG